jgi:transposase
VAEVLPANPLALKRLGSGRHTDRVDVDRLAKMVALGTVPTVWVPPQPMRGVRRLLHHRERVSIQRRRLINQAKAVLRRHGIALPKEANIRKVVARTEVESLPAEERVILLSALRQLGPVEAELEHLDAEVARQVAYVGNVRLLLTITGLGVAGRGARRQLSPEVHGKRCRWLRADVRHRERHPVQRHLRRLLSAVTELTHLRRQRVT